MDVCGGAGQERFLLSVPCEEHEQRMPWREDEGAGDALRCKTQLWK